MALPDISELNLSELRELARVAGERADELQAELRDRLLAETKAQGVDAAEILGLSKKRGRKPKQDGDRSPE